MDVSKIFSKSPDQGETVPVKPTGPPGIIVKQKSPPEIVKEYLEESFDNEGGAFSEKNENIISEVETEIRAPVVAITSMTGPVLEHPLYERYNKFWFKVRQIRDKKGKDYGTKEDPFANIRGAQEFGVKPWIGAANSANDCLTRIKQYAKTGRLENESVEDS